jgi:hypothetical protein
LSYLWQHHNIAAIHVSGIHNLFSIIMRTRAGTILTPTVYSRI